MFAEFVDGIQHGRFVPGQRLVEADLCQEFGISRGPLRETIRRLAAEGLVEIQHNRGARIKRMSREELVHLYEVREVIEGLAARMAAERATPGERDEIAAVLAAMETAIAARDHLGYADLNIRFHALLVSAAHNPTLEQIYQRLQTPTMRRQFRSLLETGAMLRSLEEHRVIIAAILAGDPLAAEAGMREHLQQSGTLIARHEAEASLSEPL
ncbi:hypothetical protein IP88_04875 [alpha proteobacterium AAP81b]|nr:hypothetical protein IP88_04875 [alpha proteobacterium AAP81b]